MIHDRRQPVLLAMFAAGLMSVSAMGLPQEAQPGPPVGAPVSAAPVRSVALFTSGVAYVNREALVNGSGSLDLRFNLRVINDLLKSMVVRDLDGGRITGVTFAPRDPLERSLQSLSLDLADNPGLFDILLRLRGEAVRIGGPNPQEGRILGVERTVEPGGGIRDRLLLDTEAGVSALAMGELGAVEFLNPLVRSDIARALALIAGGRNQDDRLISISYAGVGPRRLQIGYVHEAPVWKTTYRLAMGPDTTHLLQGWAVVENTTDEDWKDIRLDLVAGQPVSFVMDLYTPVYTRRPSVGVSLQPMVRPQIYGEGFADPPADTPAHELPRSAPAMKALSGIHDREAQAEAAFEFRAEGMEAAQSAPAAAGEFFRYTVASGVTIERRRSAMIPIVSTEIEGERVSIYNERVLRGRPLNGLRLKNTSGLSLMAGPLTVFDEGLYAGDALIDNLAPGSSRLLSFSVDLSTEVLTSAQAQPETITSVRLVRGMLLSSRVERRETTYTVANRGEAARVLLIEHPVSEGWNLAASASFEERTQDFHRFRLNLARGSQTELTVTEERPLEQSVALTNLGDEDIVFYVNQRRVSPAVKAALQRLLHLRGEAADLTRARQTVESRIAEIRREQERIRANMDAIDRASALYERYLAILGEQEDLMGGHRESLFELQNREAAARNAIDDYLAALEVD